MILVQNTCDSGINEPPSEPSSWSGQLAALLSELTGNRQLQLAGSDTMPQICFDHNPDSSYILNLEMNIYFSWLFWHMKDSVTGVQHFLDLPLYHFFLGLCSVQWGGGHHVDHWSQLADDWHSESARTTTDWQVCVDLHGCSSCTQKIMERNTSMTKTSSM